MNMGGGRGRGEAIPKDYQFRFDTVRKLLKLAVPYKWLFFFSFLCILAVNAAEVATPYITEIIIDHHLSLGYFGEGLNSITFWAILYFLVSVVSAVGTVIQQRLVSRAGQGLLHNMRVTVFSHIQRMTLENLDKYSTGRLVTRVTNDIETLNEFYSDVLVNLLRDVFLLVFIAASMLAMDTKLALVSFACLPLIAVTTFSVRNVMRRNFTRMKALIGEINGFFAENMAGMRIVQAFNRQINKMKEFRALNQRYFRTTMIQVVVQSVLRPMIEVVNALAVALLIVYGYHRISGGVLLVGVLYAFINYMKKFFNPISDLCEFYNTIQSALVSADRIYELLEDPAPLEDLESGTHGGEVIGKVEFRNVWFAYVGEEWVLKDVSFTVNLGENVAFVGPTGAGKSTIINLISRFYIPQKGQILVDDVPLEDWKLGDLRRGIAVVLQDVVLFSGDISDNIRVNQTDMTDAEIREALRYAMAEDFVDGLEDGIHSPVTERGSTFSTGERQLLSFARAIAHKPSILVLDEATANIDSHTESLIQRSIENISQGRTAIFIAHRLSTIRNCDRIYVIDDKHIAESGTHDELMEKKGLYYALHEAQFEDN